MKTTRLILSLMISVFSFSTTAEASGPVIPVKFIILQENNGQGNEIWVKDNLYIESVLKKINTDFYNTNQAELKYVGKTVVKNSKQYNSPMHLGSNPLIDQYKSKDEKGVIVVVIAREEKVDVNGRAERGSSDYSPLFIMRTVVNGKDPKKSDYVGGDHSARVTAGLFVHEMGHLMGLKHADRSKAVHTENYTKVAAGKSHYEGYLKKLASKSPRVSTVVARPKSVPSTQVPVSVSAPKSGGVTSGLLGGGVNRTMQMQQF